MDGYVIMNIFNRFFGGINCDNVTQVQVNGKSYCFKGGSNISIANGKVTVNGEEIDLSEITSKCINIVVNGNVDNLTCTCDDLTINGNVHSVDCNGNVKCNEVQGSIECNGDCTVNGNVQGSIDCNGDFSHWKFEPR